MSGPTHDDLGRLDDLGRRISEKIAELEKQGALQGSEREAAADFKLRHLRIGQKVKETEVCDGLQTDVETLRLAFERWLARIDRGA